MAAVLFFNICPNAIPFESSSYNSEGGRGVKVISLHTAAAVYSGQKQYPVSTDSSVDTNRIQNTQIGQNDEKKQAKCCWKLMCGAVDVKIKFTKNV